MSTSPVSPEDIRAAAEVQHELGPEYNDAVVASFVDKVEREVAARVEARLAATSRATAAKRVGRGALVKGIAIGVCAGTLMTVAGFEHFDAVPAGAPQQTVFPGPDSGVRLLPFLRHQPALPALPTVPQPNAPQPKKS